MNLLIVCLLGLQELSRAIDEAVEPEHRGVGAAPRASDGEFLRRLSLDLLGRAPSWAELREFLADGAADKRARRIDALLASEAFAEFWARRWSRELVDGEPAELVAWLRDGLRLDRPLNETAAAIIGSFEGPGLAFARAHPDPGAFTEAVSRKFLGIDIYCARCHDHGFDNWTTTQYYELAAFAVRRRVGPAGAREVPQDDWSWSLAPKPGAPVFLYGGSPAEGEGRSAALARLVGGHAQFSRAAANRIWGRLSDRPLVKDFDLLNRPPSRKLLDILGKAFEANGRSVKALVRAICASETYQRSASHPRPPTARYDFSRSRPRPLSPQQVLASAQILTLGRTEPFDIEDSGVFLRSSPALRDWIRDGPVLRELKDVDDLFLAALARAPSDVERERTSAFVREHGRAEAYWALLNTAEFMTRR